MRDPCRREGCRKTAHPLDPYCSRLCAEVDRGIQDVSAIAEHEKWLRNHRAGGQPLSTTNVKANIAKARQQGGATWAGERAE